MRIFGREPAMWISAIYAAIMLLAAFHVPGFDGDLAALIQVLLAAVVTAVTALMVRPVAPTVFTGVITALAALAARYGFSLSEEQIAEVIAFVSLLVTLAAARPQQTPAEPARSPALR